jgi:hypothetical protein
LHETLKLVLPLLKLGRRIEQIDVVLKNLNGPSYKETIKISENEAKPKNAKKVKETIRWPHHLDQREKLTMKANSRGDKER